MRRSAEPTAGHVELRVGKIGGARWEKPMESPSRFARVVAAPGTRGQSSVIAGRLKGGDEPRRQGPCDEGCPHMRGCVVCGCNADGWRAVLYEL